MFSYILGSGCILLIFICPMSKVGKLHSIASSAIFANLFKIYFKGGKLWWLFAQLYKNSIDYFVLDVSTVNNV